MLSQDMLSAVLALGQDRLLTRWGPWFVGTVVQAFDLIHRLVTRPLQSSHTERRAL